MPRELLPLHRLLLLDEDPELAVAFDGQKTYCRSDLKSYVSALVSELSNQAPGKWTIYCEDSFGFAVGLLAIWQLGQIAVLPVNSQAQSIENALADSIGLITDMDLFSGNKPRFLPVSNAGKSTWEFQAQDRQGVCLEMFTSGSTGTPKRVLKRFANLEDEIQTWESLYSEELGKKKTLSTVSHQHIYGLLHRLLWPLSAGRTFSAKTIFFPESLTESKDAQSDFCLVTGPAHLKRMPGLIPLESLGENCKTIFSSGGPLPFEIAKIFTESCGATPIEIYGSTETGGVARRKRSVDKNTEWEALPPIRIRSLPSNSLLSIQSPFVYDFENQWYQMDDKIQWVEANRFHLLGRADRTVKLEEKRLSLPDMEQKLQDHEMIEEIQLILLENPTEDKRATLGAACVLTENGKEYYEKEGKIQLVKHLRSHLEDYYEPVLVPKRWRILEKLPLNQQGKTIAEDLILLFEQG